jgi:hypothetical protein
MADGARAIAPDPWEELTSLIGSFRGNVQRAAGDRVNSMGLREAGKQVVQHYFRQARPELVGLNLDAVDELDDLMRGLLEVTNGRGLRKTYLSLLARMRTPITQLEGQRELRLGERRASASQVAQPAAVTTAPTEIERQIISAMEGLVATAALSYRQAIADLTNPARISFRGPANELREALREVVDELAPDEDVVGQKGFEYETDQTTPTQKQKVRYILRLQGVSGTARDTPEKSAALIEEMFASFARSTYQRSSIRTHVASARRDVLQMKMYVDVVLAELLQIHS